MKTILICDDSGRIVDKWKRALEKVLRTVDADYHVNSLSDPSLFREQISILQDRRKQARTGKAPPHRTARAHFDTANILVVDYDLLGLSPVKMGYITGENVAYLARCYSGCGLIVALNQFGNNPFDLTLSGHPESYADLNLGSDQLANPGLWSEKWTGFRPWYWPILPQACEAFERRRRSLVGHLDDEVLGYLGLHHERTGTLPRTIAQFLGRSKSPQKTTFRNFVQRSGAALEPKDRTLDDESTATIAAARLGKWLERLVLPGQEILVDAPHLVSRFPSLLSGDVRSPEAWNRTTAFSQTRLGMRTGKIDRFRFGMRDWLSRPAWFWRGLSGFEKIDEVKNPWVSREKPDLVFCEDASRFLPRNSAREFVADLPSSFVRRYAVAPNSPDAGRSEFAGVQYDPSVRFSL